MKNTKIAAFWFSILIAACLLAGPAIAQDGKAPAGQQATPAHEGKIKPRNKSAYYYVTFENFRSQDIQLTSPHKVNCMYKVGPGSITVPAGGSSAPITLEDSNEWSFGGGCTDATKTVTWYVSGDQPLTFTHWGSSADGFFTEFSGPNNTSAMCNSNHACFAPNRYEQNGNFNIHVIFF